MVLTLTQGPVLCGHTGQLQWPGPDTGLTLAWHTQIYRVCWNIGHLDTLLHLQHTLYLSKN